MTNYLPESRHVEGGHRHDSHDFSTFFQGAAVLKKGFLGLLDRLEGCVPKDVESAPRQSNV